MKRLGVYYLYDKSGIVDDYILTVLREIRKNVEPLIIISGSNLEPCSLSKLVNYSDDIIVKKCRNNYEAYRYALLKIVYSKLSKFAYDEVLFMDDMLYGPFSDLDIVFEKMKDKTVDCWGLIDDTFHNNKLDSSFIILKDTILYDNNFQNAIKKNYTMKDITKILSDYCFITYEDCIGLIHSEYKVVDQLSLPFISKKYFLYASAEYHNNLQYHYFDINKFLDRIRNYYDINQIWDNVLRTINQYDLYLSMNHNYVLPDSKLEISFDNPRVALFIHIYYDELIEYCKKYTESMPEYADIYVTTNNETMKTKIMECFQDVKVNKLTVNTIPNRGRDVSSLLVGLKDYVDKYDIICFAHDKKANQSKPYIIGEAFSYNCFENILSSKSYVTNIISLFYNTPRLGMLVPPLPNHGPYYQTISMEWQSNYKNTKRLAKRLGISVDISKDKPPIAPYGTNFWFRSDALKILFNSNITYEDFPKEPTGVNDGTIMHAIERLYPYVVQQHGYYSAWVMSETFSKLFFTNMNKYIQDINKAVVYNHMSIIEMLNDLKTSKKNILRTMSNSKKIKYMVRKIIGYDNYYVLWLYKTKILRMINRGRSR